MLLTCGFMMSITVGNPVFGTAFSSSAEVDTGLPAPGWPTALGYRAGSSSPSLVHARIILLIVLCTTMGRNAFARVS